MTHRSALILLFLFICLLSACGPDTIFLRPGLDTPAQHVKNGHSLLSYGKIDAANKEFLRATALDENYVPAYVGIALVQGHRGNIDEGFLTLERAKELINTPEEKEALDQGYKQLVEIKQKQAN
jgi:hypothetical protein